MRSERQRRRARNVEVVRATESRSHASSVVVEREPLDLRKSEEVATKSSHAVQVSVLGVLFFVGLTALVQARVLASTDWAVEVAVAVWRAALFAHAPVVGQTLDVASTGIAVLFSTEFVLIYALVASVVFWRAKLGIWALAPYTFVLLVVGEVILKLAIHQPAVGGFPARFGAIPPSYGPKYPLLTLPFAGSFPSGHAMRIGFVGVFAGTLLGERRRHAQRLAWPVLTVLMLVLGASRVYARDHWSSDVVGGLVLGTALALLVAPPIARRLPASSSRTRGQSLASVTRFPR